MEAECSYELITKNNLKELYIGNMNGLKEYLIFGYDKKWNILYNIQQPLVAALGQGITMHYYDKINEIKNFDVCFLSV